jgi:carboxypeptidase family protein
MNTRLAARKIVVSVLVCLGMMIFCATMAHAQSGGTGAITGTLTDPQGRAVPNATVTATSAATNQARTATTGGSGDYKFSLLPPGAYSLKFTAAGFKTTDVSGVTVTTTETTTVDKILEVGTVTQTVTVESTVETLQTENSTLGTTVTGGQITALPMANGNYTEILSLTAGTTASVDNATVLGKGTQDISANGADPGQNNYQMDGVAVNNIANSGSSNDGTIYTGIPIPSPDAIQEFKVQTSTYDASYGRNPGANVNVTTKSGTNSFHGSAFEYFRNTVLNANDFFLKQGQLAEGSANTRPALDQNQFGATLGGPIKKDKFFFFFSYRGTRSKNGDAPQGQDFGAAIGTQLNAFPDFATPEAADGRGSCQSPAQLGVPSGGADTNSITGVTGGKPNCSPQAQAFATALNIQSIVALRIFQLQTGKTAGVPNNYYIPSPSTFPQFCNPGGTCNFDIPAIYTENQYVANGDYIFNSKNTLSTKYFYTHNPYVTYLGQAGGDLPGTPENVLFGNQAAVLKLTTLVTSTFVNEARVSYQQNENGATVAVPPGGCPGAGSFQAPFGCGSPQALGMVPLVPGFYEPPSFLNVGTNYGLFGGLLPDKGPTNQLQAADQISWSHGKHSIRAGYEYEWTNWPLEDAGLQQGLMLILGYSSLTGAAANDGGWNLGCLFCVKSTSGNPLAGVIHFYQLNNQDTYVLDDWKVSSRLTINMGLRWEYDGLLSDKYGHLTQVWLNRMAPNSEICTGPPPLSDACAAAGVQQYVVPSNFGKSFPGALPDGVGQSRNRNSVEGHAPYSDFAPRLGFAWQPLGGGKLVVRGGAGIFYDRVGEDRVVHAFEQGYPYAATYDFGFGSPRWLQSTVAVPYPAISLVCLPSDPNCNSEPNGLGFAPRFADPTTANHTILGPPGPDFGFQVNSGLNTPLDPTSVHIPLVREYSLGVQYEFLPQWVLEVGYVGSSGINLTDYNHNHNGATLFSPCSAADITGACASDPLGICTGTTMANAICNTSNNANFRVPVLGYEAIGLESSDNDGASNYNSLQVTVRHQFARGLSMQAAYTWDKDLSDVFFGNSANINNALCLRCQWGRVSFDRPQRFVVNYSYDLPFGKGTEGITNKLIAGWNVSGVTIAQGGDPLTIIDSGIPGVSAGAGAAYGTNTSLSFQGVATAQFCSGFNNSNVKNPGGIHENLGSYINPNAFNSVTCPAPIVPFGDPTAETYGNSGVGIVLGPGQFNWDISILKNTQITEKIKMQFRSDFYNAFNHTQFADPGSGGFGGVGFEDITSPTYNQITHVSVNPRLVQFGLHFIF